MNPSVHRAYAKVRTDFSERSGALFAGLERLLEMGKESKSELLRKLKPTIALSLKWKFDYLCKTLESPFELENDVSYWIRTLEMFTNLGHEGWFEIDLSGRPQNPWKRTAEGFDLGWTKTTEGSRFQASRQIAKDRLEQILGMLGGPQSIAGKEILDSGCGPGRYIDILRLLSPKHIIGLEQGSRLVKVLEERFQNDPCVNIVHGTCENLDFPDHSFDMVISNGVLHHTSGDLKSMIRDHARVLRPDGIMFIMLVGKGGLELKMWEFVRNFLYDVPLKDMISIFDDCISPLRLQGIVDHMYGEYQETGRDEFESWGRPLFKRIERVPGIEGLDVTPEIYGNDPYFEVRFGTGQLRYLCFK